MQKYKMGCPYVVSHFPYHDELKKDILKYIGEIGAPINKDDLDKVLRSDWEIDPKIKRKYWSYMYLYLHEHMSEVFDMLGHDKHEYANYWYQQYNKTDRHRWHQHRNCSWACVYYVELPEDAPRTLIKDPFSGEIITPNIKEGDILTFPSFAWHCSPASESESVKTVVVFNVK